ncbi:hypothetical protein JCM8547_007280 [Rhodosporidiobolus lusitaniae]
MRLFNPTAVPLAATTALLLGASAAASPVFHLDHDDVSLLTSATDAPKWNCTIQAWVRAPDLHANAVLPADARLVANGSACETDIVRWSVGLKLKERAVVKLRAPEVVLPPQPVYNDTEETAFWESRDQSSAYNSLFQTDEFYWEEGRRNRSPYDLARKAYQEILANRSLWEAHASERIAFDSQVVLKTIEDGQSFPLKSVKSFQVAVPNVELPPARSPEHGWSSGGIEEQYTNAEHYFGFYASVELKNGSTLEFPASRAAFIPMSEAVEIGEETVTVVVRAPYEDAESWRWRRSEGPLPDNSTEFEVTLRIPRRDRTFQAGETHFIPAHIKRLNGTQLPTGLAIYAQSTRESSWAASFAHTPEQAADLARSQRHHMRWRNPEQWEQTTVINTTLQGEAEKLVEERKEEAEGRYRHHWDWNEGRPNVTELDSAVDEQEVLLNLTLPERLMPTAHRTFISILSYLQVSLKTEAKPNATAAVSPYPLLDDIEDNEAWSPNPYRHIEKLAQRIDSKAARNYASELTLRGNFSITVVPGANAVSPAPASLDLPPVSYLSPLAQAPLLLPISSTPVKLADVDFPLLNHDLVAEEAGPDGAKLVKSKYDNPRFRRWNHVGGANELAGQLWERKVAREKEYAALAKRMDGQQEGAQRLVLQM